MLAQMIKTKLCIKPVALIKANVIVFMSLFRLAMIFALPISFITLFGVSKICFTL